MRGSDNRMRTIFGQPGMFDQITTIGPNGVV